MKYYFICEHVDPEYDWKEMGINTPASTHDHNRPYKFKVCNFHSWFFRWVFK